MAGCEEYTELLSALQDGELDLAEQALLDEHLAACAGCRAVKERLAQVDFIIDSTDQVASSSQEVPRPELRNRIEERLARSLAAHGTSNRRPRLVARAAQLAAAALILIAVGVVIMVTGDRADAGLIDSHVTALEEASDETIKNQDALLDTLEWDLNAMKLEVRCADLDEESSSKLLERIDALLQEVDRTRCDDQKTKGDEK